MNTVMRISVYLQIQLLAFAFASLLVRATSDPGFKTQILLAASAETVVECGRGARIDSQKCGMGLCCSTSGFCGFTKAHCDISNCQKDFGQCKIPQAPSCNSDSASANRRTVGYWRSWNTEQLCDTVTPKQIDTSGLTHLYYAFVAFDEHSFAIQDADPDSYRQFTARKSSSLRTWVAIGGSDFDKTFWSKMTLSADSRSSFINSLHAFTLKYGFEGVNLDWEFPSGGDSQRLISLVRELRSSFGSEFGISLALPNDLGAIRQFDAKSLEKYVDMFEFMAYDLNWNSSTARGHTDFRDIEDIAFPLWTSGISMSKVNLGLAYYGRGFTLDDPSCKHENCNATRHIKDGPCTMSGQEGILSLNEIKRIVKDRGFSPKPIPKARYKEIVWDGQWIGYDDEETLMMKRTWASSRCFGGTMIWSVDYYNHGRI